MMHKSIRGVSWALAVVLVVVACARSGPPPEPERAETAEAKLQAWQLRRELDERFADLPAALPAQEPLRKIGSPQTLDSRSGYKAGARLTSGFAPVPDAITAPDREGYDFIAENGFRQSAMSPLSTFGLDVDTASYSNVRRFLVGGRLPPVDAVRIEELVNYFDYDYPAPTGAHPLAITTETSVAPWNPDHRLALIGVRAKDLAPSQAVPNRLVFLIDTSGSMRSADKLPLLKRAFGLLVRRLRAQDSVAIVTYAGSAGQILAPTSGANKGEILHALNRLQAGGSTAGGQGLALAYDLAMQHFDTAANNRVVLATDGDFNVGLASDGELVRLIEQRRDSGVFLTVLGFGQGNYQDAKMQKLAGHGNGSHHYVDSEAEARRVFGDKLKGTLYTVAKDVKLQIRWNPQAVAEYRLLGYENRLLPPEDFRNDRKDSGDVGAGHTVTALYEIVPFSSARRTRRGPQYSRGAAGPRRSAELAQITLRYKLPDDERAREFKHLLPNAASQLAQGSDTLRWAAAVAEFGLLLRQSEHRAAASYLQVIARLQGVGYANPVRREFVELAMRAQALSGGMAQGNEFGIWNE